MPNISKVPYSYAIYKGDGRNTVFNVPFPYISRTHVNASIPKFHSEDTPPQISAWLSDGSVKLSYAPARDVNVKIYRITPRDRPLVDYADSAVLESSDLNLGVLQNLYICEEILDELAWHGEAIDTLREAYNQLRSFYETLHASHIRLSDKLETWIASFRSVLQQCREYSSSARQSAHSLRCWLTNWYRHMLPAIRNFMYISCLDGQNAGAMKNQQPGLTVTGNTEELFTPLNGAATITKGIVIGSGNAGLEDLDICNGLTVVQIIDSQHLHISSRDQLIFDGRQSDNSEWYAWSSDALKLMRAYEYSDIALKTAVTSKRLAQEAKQYAQDAQTLTQSIAEAKQNLNKAREEATELVAHAENLVYDAGASANEARAYSQSAASSVAEAEVHLSQTAQLSQSASTSAANAASSAQTAQQAKYAAEQSALNSAASAQSAQKDQQAVERLVADITAALGGMDLAEFITLLSTGSEGMVLTKTADGYAWRWGDNGIYDITENGA